MSFTILILNISTIVIETRSPGAYDVKKLRWQHQWQVLISKEKKPAFIYFMLQK